MEKTAGKLTVTLKVETKLLIGGFDLIKARNHLGLTQDEFAALCGWSQQRQSQVELAETFHPVTEAILDKLEDAGLKIEYRKWSPAEPMEAKTQIEDSLNN